MRQIYLIAAIIICIGNLYAQVNLDSGLVAYYPFNGNANDESGNGNDGTIFGAILTEDRFGNMNSAYDFDGVDDYIDVGSDTIFDGPSEVTVSAWIQPHSIAQRVKIITKGSNVGHDESLYTWELTVSPTAPVNLPGVVRITVSDGSNPANPVSTNIVTVGSWHHIIGMYDGSITRIYLDGIFEDSSTVVSGILNNETGPLQIGRENESGIGGDEFDGVIDDIRIYYRTLTEDEIDSLFHESGWPLTGIEVVSSTIPNRFELKQNYPNPFNPSTKILYSIPKSTFVKLKIYDIAGREIQTLVSQFQTARSYSIDFNANELTSGVYIYRLQAGSFTATRKMMVVK